jgi:hypothetical protein
MHNINSVTERLPVWWVSNLSLAWNNAHVLVHSDIVTWQCAAFTAYALPCYTLFLFIFI